MADFSAIGMTDTPVEIPPPVINGIDTAPEQICGVGRTTGHSKSGPRILYSNISLGRSQWPRRLRRDSAAVCFLGLWVPAPPGAWMSVSCDCCVLPGRGLCDGLITRPGESYRMWCVSECDSEASIMRGPWPTGAVAPWKRQCIIGQCVDFCKGIAV
jgi:hypothetical protein